MYRCSWVYYTGALGKANLSKETSLLWGGERSKPIIPSARRSYLCALSGRISNAEFILLGEVGGETIIKYSVTTGIDGGWRSGKPLYM